MEMEQSPAARLYEEAREDVYYYCVGRFGIGPEEAQDLTQEVFLRLHRALVNGEEIRNLRAWVFRVVHNLALNHRAQRASAMAVGAGGSEVYRNAADPGEGVEHALLRRERDRRLQEGLDGLSEQQKRSLHLRAEGLRYQEIAQVMGVSLSTVSEYITRGVARLRKAIS